MMREPKDISSLFQNRDQELSEAPSRASWKKLERRLDAHQRRSRLSFIRSLGMVAAVLLLTVFVFLFSLFGNSNQAEHAGQVVALEFIPTQEIDPEAYRVVEYRLKYEDRMQMPIEEGTPDNKLVVRKQ